MLYSEKSEMCEIWSKQFRDITERSLQSFIISIESSGQSSDIQEHVSLMVDEYWILVTKMNIEICIVTENSNSYWGFF